MTTSLRIVGLMSGPSVDGVHAVLLEATGTGLETRFTLGASSFVPYSSDIRENIMDIVRGYASPAQVATWHYRLAEIFADTALDLLGGDRTGADLVALHGQLVVHMPQGEACRASLLLGAPSMVATRTTLTVVSDFEVADVAAGGEGGPLTSLADQIFFQDRERWRVVLNLGGNASATYLPPSHVREHPVAFDVGPGNILLNRAAYRFSDEAAVRDEAGSLAARGVVNEVLLGELLAHPYLDQPLPKSVGLDEFGEEFTDRALLRGRELGLESHDILATLSRFIASAIARSIARLPQVDEVVVTGGGIHNPTLMHYLEQELDGVPIVCSDQLGIPADVHKVAAFALLANQTIHGLPGNVPPAIGARAQTVLGSITPGGNFRELMTHIWGN